MYRPAPTATDACHAPNRHRTGIISAVIPWATQPEDGAVAVQTVVLFSGSCAAGKAAAAALQARLQGDVRALFFVPARGYSAKGQRPPYGPRSLFGDVHMEAVGYPYLVR